MILLAITLLAFLRADPARVLRYELRESAGLLFRNEDRSLRKIVDTKMLSLQLSYLLSASCHLWLTTRHVQTLFSRE